MPILVDGHNLVPHVPGLSLRDPDDEMVLDAAVNGGVEAIITFNVKDFLPEAARFHLEILTPAEAIRRLYDKDK